MQHMADAYKKLVELKKEKMEIKFSSFGQKDKDSTNKLRKINNDIASHSILLHNFRSGDVK